MDYEMEDFNFGDLEFSSLELDNAEGRLIWGIGKFFFGGLEFGIDLDSVKEEPIYSFGLAGGVNYTFNGVFRPFIDTGIRGRSDNKAVVKFGGGMDFLMGHFQITLGYNYNIASSKSYVRTTFSPKEIQHILSWHRSKLVKAVQGKYHLLHTHHILDFVQYRHIFREE